MERWFGEISEKAIRNGSFVSVPELEKAIADFLEAWNQDPKPFVWTAKVESIRETLSLPPNLGAIKPGCTSPSQESGSDELSSYFADTSLA